MNVLIVEDDNVHAQRIMGALDDMGMQHMHAVSAEEAVPMAKRNRFGVFLVDVALPGVSGFTFAKAVRERTNAPVIFMGDEDSEAQKVYGFELGADDYLVKPFGMLELSCRIRAILRRCGKHRDDHASLLRMCRDEHTVEVDGEPVSLSPIEYALMFELAMAGGRTVSKQSLIRNVWGSSSMATDQALKERMRSLRSKVGKDRIVSVYGDGYRLVPEP